MLALVTALALAAPPDHVVVQRLVDEMAAAEARMRDSSMVMHKQERKDGRLQPRARMHIKFRKPHAIYARWAKSGREVLWKRGWNGGMLRVRDGLFTLNLDPRGWLAMQGERHDITQLGFSYTIRLVVADTRRIMKRPDRERRVRYLGPREVHGRSARCWRAELPRAEDSAYYCDRSEICVDDEHKMPVLVKIWERSGERLELVEDYSYEAVRINTGLTDRDFDPENPAYNF